MGHSAPKMANRVQWKRFIFFDKETIHDHILDHLGVAPITSATAEGGLLIFGDESGTITVTDRNCNILAQTVAFKGMVRGIAYILDKSNNSRQYIVAIGDEQYVRPTGIESKQDGVSGGVHPVIKIFNIHDMKRQIQAFQVPVSSPDSCLTAFAVSEDGSQMAMGFDSGLVLLFKGNFLREGNIPRPQPVMLHASHSHPVSGLHFRTMRSNTAERSVRLFVVFAKDTEQAASDPIIPASATTAGIVVFDTSARAENRKAPVVLDERGAKPGCTSLMKENGELVVGRLDGVFAYSTEDRGGAAGFEGEKQCIATIGRYILVAAVEEKSGKAASRTAITIYDVRNKFISYHLMLGGSDSVKYVLADADVAYVITSKRALIRLKEKDTASKIEVLLRKNMYPQAISLAIEEQWDVTERLKLFKQYGDYLFDKKADYDGAIRQYSATIGYVQSSYVIRKFLDTQRMSNLTFYLEKLHEMSAATAEHTTLLLSCYTRMKNNERLEGFIDASDVTDDRTPSDGSTEATLKRAPSFVKKNRLTFDVEVALRTLEDAGYAELGMRLARMHNEHDWYLRIQLNRQTPNYDDALSYLTQLILKMPLNQVVPYILRYGRKIMQHESLPLHNLLVKVCTGAISPQELGVYTSTIDGGESTTDSTTAPQPTTNHSESVDWQQLPAPETFIPIFVDHQSFLLSFLQQVNQSGAVPISTRMTDTLLELLLEKWCQEQQRLMELTNPRKPNAVETSDPLANKKVASAEEKEPEPRNEEAIAETKASIAGVVESITSILTQSKPNYTEAQALLLAQMYGFKQGEILLLDRMQSIDLLLRRYIECGDDRAILKLLRREGRKAPDLYVQVLSHFVRNVPSLSGDDDDDEDTRWTLISEVLTLIDQQQSLPAIEVINILSQNPELPIQVVSRYIKKVLHQDSAEIEEFESGVNNVKHTIADVLRSSRDRTVSSGKSFLARNKSKSVELLGDVQPDEDQDDEEEGDELAEELDKWEKIRAGQKVRAGDHEGFFSELEHSADGFATIASYFGRAMLS